MYSLAQVSESCRFLNGYKMHEHVLHTLNPLGFGIQSDAINNVDATFLDRFSFDIGTAELEIFPGMSSELLDRHEMINGLGNSSDTLELRHSRLLQKIRATGGLRIDYFMQLAVDLGCSIQILRSPVQFRAGVSTPGKQVAGLDHIFSTTPGFSKVEDLTWIWGVRFANTNGDIEELKRVFEDLKPAFTKINWPEDISIEIDEGANTISPLNSVIDEGAGMLISEPLFVYQE